MRLRTFSSPRAKAAKTWRRSKRTIKKFNRSYSLRELATSVDEDPSAQTRSTANTATFGRHRITARLYYPSHHSSWTTSAPRRRTHHRFCRAQLRSLDDNPNCQRSSVLSLLKLLSCSHNHFRTTQASMHLSGPKRLLIGATLHSTCVPALSCRCQS